MAEPETGTPTLASTSLTTPEPLAQQPTTPQTGTTATAPMETDVVDWQAEATKWKALSRQNEAQAKSNADKAKQYDAFQESQKTELQKAQDTAADWESKYKEAQTQAFRAETAAKHQLPVELLTADTQEALEAQARALLAFKTSSAASTNGVGVQTGVQQPVTFTQAQIADQKFYQTHRDDILKAMSEGRIK